MDQLRPKLRSDLKITRQSQRDGVHYVIKDPLNQQYYRFSEAEYLVISLFNGERIMEEALAAYSEKKSGFDLNRETLQEYRSSLDKMNLFEKPLAEQNLFLLENMREQRKSKLLGVKGSPMYFRIHILDPNYLLNWIYPKIRWIYTPKFIMVASLALFMALFLLFQEWELFLDGMRSIVNFENKSPSAWFGLWLTVIIVIFFHELGHAFTCRHFGGEVHDMGILMLFFTPCFYANVNDAWSFPNRSQKLWVTFAGGLTEFMIGTLAVFAWYFLNPTGNAHGIAYQVMSICALSSVMFNFNPLMKLDGYYAFSDFVGIPNLKAESAGYVKYLSQKYLFALPPKGVTYDNYSEREKRILFGYGICSILYMTSVLFGLFMMARVFLLDQLKGIGVLLSLFVAWKLFRGHFLKLLGFIKSFYREKLKGAPWRLATALLLIFLVGFTAILAIGKLTLTLDKKGTITAGSKKVLFAPISGFLIQENMEPGTKVDIGQKLGTILEWELKEKKQRLELDLKSTQLRLFQARSSRNLLSSAEQESNIKRIRSQITDLEEKIQSGEIRSPLTGVIRSNHAENRKESYVARGSELAEIADSDSLFTDIHLLESELRDIRLGDRSLFKIPALYPRLVAGFVYRISPSSEDYTAPEKKSKGLENRFQVRILLRPETDLQEYLLGRHGIVSIRVERVGGFELVRRKLREIFRPDLFT